MTNCPELDTVYCLVDTTGFSSWKHLLTASMAFAKTRELQPNQSETLTMKVSLYDLASYNEGTQAWETAPGKYTIGFGANVEDIRATAPYNLSRQYTVKCHDVMRPDM